MRNPADASRRELITPRPHGQVIENLRRRYERRALAHTVRQRLAGRRQDLLGRGGSGGTIGTVEKATLIRHDRAPVFSGEIARDAEAARGSAAVRARRSRLTEHGAQRRAHGLDGENPAANSKKSGRQSSFRAFRFSSSQY